MARYHINPQTGSPGLCRAKHSCPFGSLQTEHYESQDEARQAYEKQQTLRTSVPEPFSQFRGNVDRKFHREDSCRQFMLDQLSDTKRYEEYTIQRTLTRALEIVRDQPDLAQEIMDTTEAKLARYKAQFDQEYQPKIALSDQERQHMLVNIAYIEAQLLVNGSSISRPNEERNDLLIQTAAFYRSRLESTRPARYNTGDFTLEPHSQNWRRNLSNQSDYWLNDSKGAPVGYVKLADYPDHAVICDIEINPDYRGRGYSDVLASFVNRQVGDKPVYVTGSRTPLGQSAYGHKSMVQPTYQREFHPHGTGNDLTFIHSWEERLPKYPIN